MADTNPREQAFLKAHTSALSQITGVLFERFNIPETEQMGLFITACLGSIIGHLTYAMCNGQEMPYVEDQYQNMVENIMQEAAELIHQRLEEKLPNLYKKADLN